MPAELYLKQAGLIAVKRLRKITQAVADTMTKIGHGLYTQGTLTAPVNTVAPVISGAGTTVGTVFSVTDGTWTGNPTPTYTYQWKIDTVNVPGQTSSTYDSSGDSVGEAVTCEVTATNSEGSASQISNSITLT